MQRVQDLLSKEIIVFKSFFKSQFVSENRLLRTILQYLLKQKGKQVRPLIVLVCAKMHGNIDEKAYRAAALIELLHTATLVHDDVVDTAEKRRGVYAVSTLWKNKIGVLSGDYLLSKGLLLALENNDIEVLRIVSQAVKDMADGELLQLEKARRLDITEEVYFKIIEYKTATLMAASCSAGAYASSQSKEISDAMWQVGLNLGICFQIKDDLLDYSKEDIGKPRGHDLKDQKMTLPIIHTLNNCTARERKEIIYLFKNKNLEPSSFDTIYGYVHQYGGLQYAHDKMLEYAQRAKDGMAAYPPSEAKEAFSELIDFVTTRKK